LLLEWATDSVREPYLDCHSERSEESRSAAQGKLREEPVLNEVKESRSEYFQRTARFLVARGSSE
jgi:hypothetical protein